MKEHFRILSVFVSILVQLPAMVHGQEGISRKQDIPGAQLDTIALYIHDFPVNTQLSIAMINDSTASFLGFVKSADGWSVLDNRDSVFEIGSITKVFTSALLAGMVDEGLVSLDDPISGMLPFETTHLEKEGRPITLKTLANHTSGLPRLPLNLMLSGKHDPGNPYKNYGYAQLLEFFKNQAELQSVPGITYHYSNLGAAVLGYLLELKSGKPYEDLLLENICSSYGMYSTTTQRNNIASRLVRGRDKDGKVVSNWDFLVFKGAGAILSSTKDLSLFVKANFQEDKVLALQRAQTFSTGISSGIALGWHILERDSGETWHWHNGATGGYRSQMVMDVENRNAVIILSNVSGSNPNSNNIDQLGFLLLETLQLYDTLKLLM